MGADSTHTKSGIELLIHPKEASESHYCHVFLIISLRSIFLTDTTRSNILLLLKAKHKVDSCETKYFSCISL